MSAWPRPCECGRSYSACDWLDLEGAGRMKTGDDGGPEIDLRHCLCRRIMAVRVEDLEDDARLEFEIKRSKRIDRHYEASFAALKLARRYERECSLAGRPWSDDHRISACLRQVAAYRKAIHAQRLMAFGDADAVIEVCPREGALRGGVSKPVPSGHEKNAEDTMTMGSRDVQIAIRNEYPAVVQCTAGNDATSAYHWEVSAAAHRRLGDVQAAPKAEGCAARPQTRHARTVSA